MVIIKISKGFLNFALLSILAVSIGAGVFLFCRHFYVPTPVHGTSCIEIFDIGRGEVIKQVEPDRETRREAEMLLKNIKGLYLKFKPLPDKGCIVRIPLEPASRIKNKWLNDCGIAYVDALYVLLPEEDAPYLLVLDGKQRPFFFNTEGDIRRLQRFISHTLCNVGV